MLHRLFEPLIGLIGFTERGAGRLSFPAAVPSFPCNTVARRRKGRTCTRQDYLMNGAVVLLLPTAFHNGQGRATSLCRSKAAIEFLISKIDRHGADDS